jgi:hypothetical protein
MMASPVDGDFLRRLWSVAREMVLAFMEPDLGWEVPPDALVGVLVFGVFLLVAGSAFAVQGRGRFLRMAAVAAGVSLAGWVLFGGMGKVATFFVVVLLLLKFLGGVTLVLGMFRSFWGPAVVLAAVLLGALGLVEVRLLAFVLAVLASLLGAWSLLQKAEEFSPGKRGSRWNRCTAVGWVCCLLAAGMLRSDGLAAHGDDFKLAGVVVGIAVLLLLPRSAGKKVRVKVG